MNKVKALLTSTEAWVAVLVLVYNILVAEVAVFPNVVWLTVLVNILGPIVALYFHAGTAQIAKQARSSGYRS